MSHHKNILLVEDDLALQEALVDTLELNGYKVRTADSAEQALLTVQQQIPSLILSDVQLGGLSGLQLLSSLQRQGYDIPVIMMTAYAHVDDAVKAMRMGAVDYLSKPFATDQLLELLERYAPRPSIDLVRPVVGDKSSEDLLRLTQRVATTDATVMITGPSGSGKEVLAQFIHHCSVRRDGPFVAINCAAIPENMLEATLFGYEKGAFTGAVQSCVGKFEQANGGTLLLDEITEMDLGLQAKILRVIQERHVERLGSRKEIKLDVRIVATSNRDLREAVASGIFREDLYYRLNVFPLEIPPLRERPADVLPLARHFLVRHAAAMRRSAHLAQDAVELLADHAWPGNVRELENTMQRALILAPGDHIDAATLALCLPAGDGSLPVIAALPTSAANAAVSAAQTEARPDNMKELERAHILSTLRAVGGSRKRAVERLGISERTLRYKLQQYRAEGHEF